MAWDMNHEPGEAHHLYVGSSLPNALGRALPPQLAISGGSILYADIPGVSFEEFSAASIMKMHDEVRRAGRPPQIMALAFHAHHVRSRDEASARQADLMNRNRKLDRHRRAEELVGLYAVAADGRRWIATRVFAGPDGARDVPWELRPPRAPLTPDELTTPFGELLRVLMCAPRSARL